MLDVDAPAEGASAPPQTSAIDDLLGMGSAPQASASTQNNQTNAVNDLLGLDIGSSAPAPSFDNVKPQSSEYPTNYCKIPLKQCL